MAGCKGEEVGVVECRRGEIVESFDEPAETRLEETFLVTVPVDGRIGRVALEPGDRVTKGQSLADYDRVPFDRRVEEARAAVGALEARLRVQDDHKLEETAKTEAEATINAAHESLKAADKQVEARRAFADRARKERIRKEELAKSDTIGESELDDAILNSQTADIDLTREQLVRSALNFVVVAIRLGPQYIEHWLGRKALQREVTVQEALQAKARLALAEHQSSLACVESPIDGVVLERYHRGDATMAAGEPLLLLGDLDQMEVLAEVLTGDAMRLREGSEVLLEAATRAEPIPGKVKRIEPYGFTKLSSLGVEQQRVKVIVSLDERPDGLGAGYRLQARFVTGRRKDAIVVPRYSVLQAPDRSYYVFKVDGGVLSRQPVRLGLRSDLELEIVEGLEEGDLIVSTPDTTMREGQKISPQPK